MARDPERDNPPKPMNVEQIVKIAHFDYNAHVPLRYWLRTAGTLVKEVHGHGQPRFYDIV